MIRPAEPGDTAAITRLLQQLGYPHNNDETQVRQRIAAWTTEPHATVLIAESAGSVDGLLALATVPYFERPGRWGRVVAIVVADHARGNGIGRALMAEAEHLAHEDGCIAMKVSSANARTDAHAFYRGLGYDNWADRAGNFRKDLVPGTAAASYAARFPATD